MNKVLLSHLHQEIGVEPNVKVNIVDSLLRLRNVQVQASVKHADSFRLVSLEAPFDHSLQEEVICGLLAIGVPKLSQELKLVLSVIDHLLLDTAVDHTV